MSAVPCNIPVVRNVPFMKEFFALSTHRLRAILLTFGLTVPLALAQQPNRPAPPGLVQEHVGQLTSMLNLTGAQQQQATSIYSAAANTSVPIEHNLETAEQNLHTAVQRNDSAAMRQYATAIGNATTQLALSDAQADAAFYRILTPAQQGKLNQLDSQNEGSFGKGAGPGGQPGRPH